MVRARITSAAGQTEVVQHRSRPWTPRYLVDSASFLHAEPSLLTKNISIVDHNESFFVKSAPPRELRTFTITLLQMFHLGGTRVFI